jgi:hypothetical protein
VADPYSKKRAAGMVVVEGQAGATVPKGTIFHRADGLGYETASAATIGEDESVKVAVVARAAGVAGQCAPGVVLHCKEEPEHFCADCIVDVDGLAIPGAPAASGPAATADGPHSQGLLVGATPGPADAKAPAASSSAPAPTGAPSCFVHLQVNGRGAVRVPATYRGRATDGHAATFVLTDGRGQFVDHALDGLPEHDPKNPTWPSIEVP